MSYVSVGRSSACALFFASLACAAGPSAVAAAPAVGDPIYSGGLIGSKLVDVSADGRFVLVETSVAEIPMSLVLVDRTTKASEPVLWDDAHERALGTTSHYRGLDVSDDGNRILIGRYDQSQGEIDRLFVYDRSAQTNTTVSTLPNGEPVFKLAGIARFLDGGTGVLFGAVDAAGKETTYKRATLTGPAVAFAEGTPNSATRRGDVVTWSRNLPTAVAPTEGRGPLFPTTRPGGGLTGYTIEGQGSKIIDQTKIVETAGAPEPYCIEGGVTYVRVTPGTPRVDDYGHAITVGPSSTFDERFPSGPRTDEIRPFDTSEDGSRQLTGRYRLGYTPLPVLEITPPRGTAGLPDLPELASAPDVYTSNAKFFAHGTGIVRDEYEVATNGSRIAAYGEIGAGTAPEVRVPAAVPGAKPDTATVQPDITWAQCKTLTPPATRLGEVDQYAKIALAKPATTGRSAGTVKVTLNPSAQVRTVPQVTLKVQTLGFTTWSRTVKADETVTLPRPYWLLPQTLIAQVAVGRDPETGAPATQRQASVNWQAYR